MMPPEMSLDPWMYNNDMGEGPLGLNPNNHSYEDSGISFADNSDAIFDEDDDGFMSFQGTYYNSDGNILDLSNDGPGYVYDFGEEVANSTENLSVDLPIPKGRLVALSLFVVLFFVGIIGNALVISTVVRFGNMRKVTYLYLVNLAVADLLYLLACVPTATASYALVEWPFGVFYCRLENYLTSVSMAVSVLTIMATSFDRYLAILYPVRSRPLRTTKITLFIIGTVWIFSLTLLTTRIHLFDTYNAFHIVGFTKLCGRRGSQRELKIDTCLVFIFLYLLPQIVLALCHYRIGRKLWHSERPGIRNVSSIQQNIFGMKERRRVAKILIVITVVFGVGWLPIHLYHIVEVFDFGNVLLGEYLDRGTVALFFSFGANSLNPFFYCVFSSAFRKHFKQTLLCRRNTIITSLGPGQSRRADVMAQPRPPTVLLPRPASILPSPTNIRDEMPIHLQPLLSRDLSVQGKNTTISDLITPLASPLSVEELTGIRVSDSEQPSTSFNASSTLSSSLKTSFSSLYVQDITLLDDHFPEIKNKESEILDFTDEKKSAKCFLRPLSYSSLETTSSNMKSAAKPDITNRRNKEHFSIDEQRYVSTTHEQQYSTDVRSLLKKLSPNSPVDVNPITTEDGNNTASHSQQNDDTIETMSTELTDLNTKRNWKHEHESYFPLKLCIDTMQQQLPKSKGEGNSRMHNSKSHQTASTQTTMDTLEKPESDPSSSNLRRTKTDVTPTSTIKTPVNPARVTCMGISESTNFTEDFTTISEVKTRTRSKNSPLQVHCKDKLKKTKTAQNARHHLSPVTETTLAKESTFFGMPNVD